MKPRKSQKNFVVAVGVWRQARAVVMRRTHFAALALALFLLGSAPAIAYGQENAEEIGRLKKKLADQEALIQKQGALVQELLRRLEALEASPGRTGSKSEPVSPTGGGEAAAGEGQGKAIAEIRNDLDETAGRLEQLPRIGGYYDFEYLKDARPDTPGTFRQHHVALFVSQEYERMRWFSEIEFEFGPKFEGAGGGNLETARGEVKVEQGWGEYILSDQLILRGGLMLTPGYWNVRHWPNLVLSTRRPLMVRNVYPESFTGVMAHGSKHWGEFGLSYEGYVGNGESPNSAKQDDNGDKAVGGLVSFHVPTKKFFDSFDLGISSYTDHPPAAPRTRTWGAEVQIRKGPFEFLSEFARRNALEDRTGTYLQPAYQLTKRLTAFYRYDLLNIQRASNTREHTVGLNSQLIPQARLKIEYLRSNPSVGEGRNGVAASFVVSY